MLEFMDRRIFGPERLTHLRAELSSDDRRGRGQELKQLQSKLKDVEDALYRQTLHMEEDEDPTHPVVAHAKQRIIQLTVRHEKLQAAILSLEREREATRQAEKIESTLADVPGDVANGV
jgi:hypothetical protein